LFEPDNIHDRLSNKKLRALGGIVGIAKSLKTNLRTGISESDIELRIESFGKNDPVKTLTKTLF